MNYSTLKIWWTIVDVLWAIMLLVQVLIAKFNDDTNELIFWMGLAIIQFIVIFRQKKFD